MGAKATRGIGRYIEELVRAMLEIAPWHRYVMVTRLANHPFVAHSSVETIVADTPWYSLAEQMKMPRILKSAQADAIHIPHWNVPLTYSSDRLVVTIHDLLLRHESMSARSSTRNFITRSIKRLGYRFTLNHAISAAKKIVVPTTFVANDVASFYPRVASKLIVTGEGMPNLTTAGLGLSSKFQIPNSKLPTTFLLYVGSAYPHKGLVDLLVAWDKLARNYPDLHLIIAGEMDTFMKRMKSFATEKKLLRINFLGSVNDDELDDMYARATALVYPTHFEGFGLPPLEALAAGCPVISSDAPALRETLGSDGATFFHVGDVDGIIAAVEETLRDPTAARNARLAAMTRLAQQHSWKHAAQRTLEVYQAMLH